MSVITSGYAEPEPPDDLPRRRRVGKRKPRRRKAPRKPARGVEADQGTGIPPEDKALRSPPPRRPTHRTGQSTRGLRGPHLLPLPPGRSRRPRRQRPPPRPPPPRRQHDDRR